MMIQDFLVSGIVDDLASGAPIAADDPRTWYVSGPEGYIDYPPHRAEAA